MKKHYLLPGIIFLITVLCWLLAKPTGPISATLHFSQLAGTLALTGLSYVNFISTRHPLVDRLFNGLDKAYTSHKWVSILSIILIIVHIGVLAGNDGLIIARGVAGPEDAGGMIGWPSFILFIALVLVAVLAKRMNYEAWKYVHKLLFLPYLLGLVHYYRCADYAVLALSPFSIWVNLINLLGIISAVYSVFLYERTAFPYHYTISHIRPVAKDTIEITGTTTGNDLKFIPGQFTFLKFPDKNIKFRSHPFTMSQAPKKGEIQFTIKSLGDHTAKLIKNVKTGHEFAVSRAHGMFNYATGSRRQIWIAGGIGITPFRSFYQAGIPEEFSIDFFYAYNNREECPYLEEVQALAQKTNLRLYLIDYTEKGFLTVETIQACVDTKNPVDIYFCGPRPMRENLRKHLPNSGLKVLNFFFDEFEFK